MCFGYGFGSYVLESASGTLLHTKFTADFGFLMWPIITLGYKCCAFPVNTVPILPFLQWALAKLLGDDNTDD